MTTIEPTDQVTIDFGGLELTGTLRHDDERRSLVLVTDNGPEIVSINLEVYGLIPEPGRVFIKDWSEHVSLAKRMEDDGLITIESSFVISPYGPTGHQLHAYEVVVE